jgi:hypothetical protein
MARGRSTRETEVAVPARQGQRIGLDRKVLVGGTQLVSFAARCGEISEDRAVSEIGLDIAGRRASVMLSELNGAP